MYLINNLLIKYPVIVHIAICILLLAVLIYGALSGYIKGGKTGMALIISSLLLSILPEYFLPAFRSSGLDLYLPYYHPFIWKFYLFTMALFPLFLQRSGIVIKRAKILTPFVIYLIFCWVTIIFTDVAGIIFGRESIYMEETAFWVVSSGALMVAGFFTIGCYRRLEYLSHDFNKDILRAVVISFFSIFLCSTMLLLVLHGGVTDFEATLCPVVLISMLFFAMWYFTKIGDASHLAIGYKSFQKDDDCSSELLEDSMALEKNRNSEEIVRRLINYFDSDKPYLNKKINVGMSSRKLYTNRSYFSDAINRVCHMNFSQFCNRYKLRESIRLFLENDGNIPITEFYTKSGFSSLSGFISAFNKNIGVSPGEWSRKMSALLENHIKISIDDILPFDANRKNLDFKRQQNIIYHEKELKKIYQTDD